MIKKKGCNNMAKKLTKEEIKNAKEKINDLYLPLYKLLIELNCNANNKDKIKLCAKKLDNFIAKINKSGISIYLASNIEKRLSNFLFFIESSLNAKNIRYGLLIKINSLSNYTEKNIHLNFELNRVTLALISVIIGFLESINFIIPFKMKNFFKIEITETEFVIYSAPIESTEFKAQFEKYIDFFKKEIKLISLGKEIN